MTDASRAGACCGNCAHAQDVDGDHEHVECHGGPPSVMLVPTEGEYVLREGAAGLARFQRVTVWPLPARAWLCAWHADAEGGA